MNLSFNSSSLLRDGKPWFPIMGEIHYSRCDRRYWREAILKMKAGGVDIISCYVIWIHVEEVEGEYDFSGNRDLREFLRVCAECRMFVWLRIGPWCHGEVRNGGFPDWLLKKPFPLRENNEGYFGEVRKFYSRISKEARPYLDENGGTVIGIQIENEYGHCGGLTGAAGEEHMRTLLSIAKETGLKVPVYTATGWGGAVTAGMLPVMGGYCEAPWDPRLTEIEPSGNYIFTYERNDHNIGSDLGLGAGTTFDAEKFPYLTAELGGGMQVTLHRRPVATAADIGAMSLAKLGSGVNLLGYYMYHGGTNPKGKLTTLQESTATGYPNDLPELSYDFNAPIKEYGQISETFKELRLLTMFLSDFGEELCSMPAYIPKDNPLHPENLSDIRTSLRHNGESGYIFINNYQRKRKMAQHKNISLSAEIGGITYTLPETDINNGDYAFYPLNMKIGNGSIASALATPLCVLNGNCYVFYGKNEFRIEGDVSDCEIKLITREQAKNCTKLHLERDYLVITDGLIIDDNGYKLYGGEEAELGFYPEPAVYPDGFEPIGYSDGFWRCKRYVGGKKGSVQLRLKKVDRDNSKLYEAGVIYPEGVENCFLRISWAGNIGELYINGEKRADQFYTGQTWDIGLRTLDFPENMEISVKPLYPDTPLYLEDKPEFICGVACRIEDVRIMPEYKTALTFSEGRRE